MSMHTHTHTHTQRRLIASVSWRTLIHTFTSASISMLSKYVEKQDFIPISPISVPQDSF